MAESPIFDDLKRQVLEKLDLLGTQGFLPAEWEIYITANDFVSLRNEPKVSPHPDKAEVWTYENALFMGVGFAPRHSPDPPMLSRRRCSAHDMATKRRH